MAPDPTMWMPQDMPLQDRLAIAGRWPGDPHNAAADAWEAWAAALPPEPGDGAQSVSTGAQSVTYGPGGAGAFGDAMRRAAWHRSRGRVRSVQVGPQHVAGWSFTHGVMDEAGGDDEDRGVIATVDVGTIPRGS